MSAIVLEAARRRAGEPGQHATPSARPHLVLVPTGRDAVRAARGLQTPMRLTRFGRIVVALLVAVAVSVLGVGLAGQIASAQGEPRTIVVESGQTLWGIASRELPELPVTEGIVELQLANDLSTDQVHAGQRLLVPAR